MKILRLILLVTLAAGLSSHAFAIECSSLSAAGCSKAIGAMKTICCKCYPTAAGCGLDKCSSYTQAGCLKEIAGGSKTAKDVCCSCFNYKTTSYTSSGCMKLTSADARNLCLLCVRGYY